VSKYSLLLTEKYPVCILQILHHGIGKSNIYSVTIIFVLLEWISNFMNEENRMILSEEIEAQQIQINSLATSLQQVLFFLQDQKSQGSVDISQESIKYLDVVLNNLEVIKQQIDIIKPGFLLIEESIEKASYERGQELKQLNENLKILQNKQSKLYSLLVSTRKSLFLQSNDSGNNLSWPLLMVSGVCAVGIVFGVVSIIHMNLMVSKLQESNTIIQKELQITQKYLGVKHKK
jgi:hypothetical protein